MTELDRLRCCLRAVNIEYSALVRRKTEEAVDARMAELRTERKVFVALIAAEHQFNLLPGSRETRPLTELATLRSRDHPAPVAPLKRETSYLSSEA
jgi:hypothetical protein